MSKASPKRETLAEFQPPCIPSCTRKHLRERYLGFVFKIQREVTICIKTHERKAADAAHSKLATLGGLLGCRAALLPFRESCQKLGSPNQSLRSCRGRGRFRAETLSGVLLSGSSGPHSCRGAHCAVTPRERFPARRASHARLPGGQEPLTMAAEGKVW